MIAQVYHCEAHDSIKAYRFDSLNEASAFAIAKGYGDFVFKEKDKKEWIVFNHRPDNECTYHRIGK